VRVLVRLVFPVLSATLVTLKTDAKRYLKSAAMILLTLPVLYFLSIGPTIFVWDKFHLERSCPTLTAVLVGVYSPVVTISMKDTPVGTVLRKYFHFCNPEIPEELPVVPAGL
jgi:hypothetical protein